MANTSGFNTCQSHSSSYEGREGEGRRREGGTAGGREEGRGEGARETRDEAKSGPHTNSSHQCCCADTESVLLHNHGHTAMPG